MMRGGLAVGEDRSWRVNYRLKIGPEHFFFPTHTINNSLLNGWPPVILPLISLF